MSDSVTVKVPHLRPLLTPHDLREATIRDYKRAAERAGMRVDSAALERLAVADCELAERVNAEREEKTPGKIPDQSIRRMTVEGEANKAGATTMIDPRKVRRRKLGALHDDGGADRWRHAKGRVARIMAGASSHTDRVRAYSTCELPHLAFALFRVYANVVIRHRQPRPGDEPNPYFGLSDVDVNRLLQRQVEDICDLSTGRLGPWRTPK